jgi:hypothetical protein
MQLGTQAVRNRESKSYDQASDLQDWHNHLFDRGPVLYPFQPLGYQQLEYSEKPPNPKLDWK